MTCQALTIIKDRALDDSRPSRAGLFLRTFLTIYSTLLFSVEARCQIIRDAESPPLTASSLEGQGIFDDEKAILRLIEGFTSSFSQRFSKYEVPHHLKDGIFFRGRAKIHDQDPSSRLDIDDYNRFDKDEAVFGVRIRNMRYLNVHYDYVLINRTADTRKGWKIQDGYLSRNERKAYPFKAHRLFQPGMVFESAGNYRFKVLGTFEEDLLVYDGWYLKDGKRKDISAAVEHCDLFLPLLRDLRRELQVEEFQLPSNMADIPWYGDWPLTADFGLRLKNGRFSFFPINYVPLKKQPNLEKDPTYKRPAKPVLLKEEFVPYLPPVEHPLTGRDFFMKGLHFANTAVYAVRSDGTYNDVVYIPETSGSSVWTSGHIEKLLDHRNDYFLNFSYPNTYTDRDYWTPNPDIFKNFQSSKIFFLLKDTPNDAPKPGSMVRDFRILAYYGTDNAPVAVYFDETKRQFGVNHLSVLLNPPLVKDPLKQEAEAPKVRSSKALPTLLASTVAAGLIIGIPLGRMWAPQPPDVVVASPEPSGTELPPEPIVSAPPSTIIPEPEPPVVIAPPTANPPQTITEQEGTIAKTILLDIRSATNALAKLHLGSDVSAHYAAMSAHAEEVLPDIDLEHDLSARTIELMQGVRTHLQELQGQIEHDLHHGTESQHTKQATRLYEAFRRLDRVILEKKACAGAFDK